MFGITLIMSVATVVMVLAGYQVQDSVTLSSQTICAVTGSTVKIPCKYTQRYESVANLEWYQVKNSENHHVVLSKHQRPSEASVSTDGYNCELTLSSVKEKDSGIYYFRFKSYTDWISSSSGVNLTVRELKVTVSDKYSGKELSCNTTCTLGSKMSFIWYKNGKPVSPWYNNMLYVYGSTYADSYSCAVKGLEELRSPPVCVYNENSCWSVTYTPQSVCTLIGSSVDIHSYFTFPKNQKVKKSFWFIGQQTDAEPVDLKGNEEYKGRIQFNQCSQNDCSLRITNVKESDAHTYSFRFHTDDAGGKYTGYPGVTLSVTELKVTVSDTDRGGKKLSCSNTCHSKTSFIWYKNGKPVSIRDSDILYVDGFRYTDSYSCAVKGLEELRAPAVCVYNENSCWSVTYTPQSVCTLIGSSVDIHSYFTFPNNQKVKKSFWFISQWSWAEPKDLKGNKEYKGRIQYIQRSQNDCSLRITNVKESDAHTYMFKFYTDGAGDKYSGKPGVTLSVTGLQVKVEPSVTWKQTVTLRCVTSCSLPNNPTYIWYKNMQRVLHCISSSCVITRTSGDVDYNCAVEGQESLTSPPLYSPRNARAFILPSAETVEGGLVTLICTSNANPPVLNYTWFRQRTDADTLLGTGQNYSINNISSEHSGFYYCTAENLLGQINSTTVCLDVLYSPQHTNAIIFPSGDRVEGDSVTLTCSSDANPPVLNYTWFRRRGAANTLLGTGQNYSIDNIDHQHSGLYYCTAHNRLGHNNSTAIHLDVLYNTAVKYVACGLSVLLVPIIIVIFLSIRKTLTSSRSHNTTTTEMSFNERDNKDSAAAVYDNISVLPNISHSTKAADSSDEDEVYYASIHLPRSLAQQVHLQPNVHPAIAQTQQEEVEYAAVKFTTPRAKTRMEENPIYSTVQ